MPLTASCGNCRRASWSPASRRRSAPRWRLAFARRGYDVLVNYTVSEAEARETERACREAGADVLVVRGDVADDASWPPIVAAAMARCGAARGLAGLDRKHYDRAALRHALQHAISQHEQLWLARNRPGGLTDSSARLRAQLRRLE